MMRQREKVTQSYCPNNTSFAVGNDMQALFLIILKGEMICRFYFYHDELSDEASSFSDVIPIISETAL